MFLLENPFFGAFSQDVLDSEGHIAGITVYWITFVLYVGVGQDRVANPQTSKCYLIFSIFKENCVLFKGVISDQVLFDVYVAGPFVIPQGLHSLA